MSPAIRNMLRQGTLATAVPLTVAVAVLGLFTVPNYLRAAAWSREARQLRTVALESAARQDNLRDVQRHVEQLRGELARRGRTLPATPDQGALLASLARSGELKGMQSSEARTGKMNVVTVPGLADGKAARRGVDAQVAGSFDAIFSSLAAAESLPVLVAVRSIELGGNAGTDGLVEGRLTFDEFFAEQAAAGSQPAGKAGVP